MKPIEIRMPEGGLKPPGPDDPVYLFADPIHLIPKEMAAEWEKKHGPLNITGTPKDKESHYVSEDPD